MNPINYEKYLNMTRGQLLNSLTNAEKREQKLKVEAERKINETKELIKFLKAKIKESLDNPYDFVSLEKSYIEKKYNTFSEEYKEELRKEVEKDMKEAGANNNEL